MPLISDHDGNWAPRDDAAVEAETIVANNKAGHREPCKIRTVIERTFMIAKPSIKRIVRSNA
jgi:hypothetical protein